MTTTTTPSAPAAGRWKRLYRGETTYDFVGRKWIGFGLSGILLVVTVVSLLVQGLNLGIDFEGGVAWEVETSETLDQARAESILADNGIDPATAKIQTLRSPSGERLRIQVGDLPEGERTQVRDDLADAAGVDAQEVSINAVSPTWGEEITDKAVRALVIFLIAIAVYITFRFEWKMAVGALAAVVHDVLISVGVYSVFQWEVTPATVIAFLTILGFSLYDTIVVFDKVHENTRRLAGGRITYAEIVNLSMNQVLMRSINTSIAAVLPVASLLVVGSWLLGAVALEDFSLALLVGLLIGSYSSIFIATPILSVLKEREPRYRRMKERAAVRPDQVPAPATVGAPAAAGGDLAETTAAPAAPARVKATSTAAADRPSGLGHPPRPRKRKRR